jgi:ABC-type nitrate/sulfonate/bicarbonate transport system permease component
MSRKSTLLTLEICVPLLILALWFFGSSNSHSFYFPPLKDILQRFAAEWLGAGFVEHGLPSLYRMTLGYVIGSAIAIALGTALGLSRTVHAILGPTIEFLRALPSVVLIPFGIVVFGVDTSMKVFVIALGCFFPVLLSTLDGVRSVEPLLLDVSRTFKFNRGEMLGKVILPAASPQIFAGLRTALSLALILMVVSEMVASTDGIGYAILESQRLFEIPDMWAGILVLGLLGYLINFILMLVEKKSLGWYHGFKASVLNQ